MFHNEKTAASWNKSSDAYYRVQYEDGGSVEQLKENPSKAFPSSVWKRIRQFYPSLEEKRVLVASSGDNIAAFGFHLLGAKVTSSDLSSEQIRNAGTIAAREGWDIDYIVQDSMALLTPESDCYDLVYTSNGTHVWISDLGAMYRGFYRVLKRGGHYIFFETHPFIRPFDDNSQVLEVVKPYDEIGPFGDIPNYLWRVQDFVNALTESGFAIKCMDEMYAQKDSLGSEWWELADWDRKSDWKINPYAALPQWISFCSQKA